MNNKVLVAIDIYEEKTAQKLLEYATQVLHPEGELTIVNVLDLNLNSSMIDRFYDVKREYVDSTQKRILRLVKQCVPSDIQYSISVLNGKAYDEILELAEKSGVDMILVGAYRQVMRDYLLGNTATKVVRHAKCSVTVLR
ncbi:MAG: universal stress protein [Pseudomonadota bacterium]|nr:universal stress protein [Pseudomonadota bacterium]MEC8482612.1 universal stress protein [Pseudomonadota bacterium]